MMMMMGGSSVGEVDNEGCKDGVLFNDALNTF